MFMLDSAVRVETRISRCCSVRREESVSSRTDFDGRVAHILELICRLSVAEKILFNPPRSKVPLHAITKGLGAFPIATKT